MPDSLGIRPAPRARAGRAHVGTLHPVLVLSAQATAFATTCYVVAPAPDSPCLVLDPGAGVAAAVTRIVEAHGLAPVAVAATHGHPDHVWDAAALCRRWDVPLWLGEGDVDRLADPAQALGPALGGMFRAIAASPWEAPPAVEPFPSGTLTLAEGLRLDPVPAPGHTPGSTVLLAPGPVADAGGLPPSVTGRPLPQAPVLAFTGDVLFAGSIGRTDLPGGDDALMAATLRLLVERIPGEAWVLPGHGPTSTMAHERTHNPYLGVRRPAPGRF